MKVAVEGAQAEHKGAMDSEEFEHIGPRQTPSLKMVFQRWMGDLLHDEDAFVGQVFPHGRKLQFRHREMLFNRLGLGNELITSVDFVEQVEFPERVVFNVGEQSNRIPDFSQPWIEKKPHSNPTLHALNVSLKGILEIGFDDLHHHLGAVLEHTTVDLANACSGKRFHVEVLEVVEESVGGEAVEEALRVFLWNGCGAAVELLKFDASVGVDQIGTKGEDLAKLDRQQPH